MEVKLQITRKGKKESKLYNEESAEPLTDLLYVLSELAYGLSITAIITAIEQKFAKIVIAP